MAERIGLEAVLITSNFQKGVTLYTAGTNKLLGQTAKTSKAMSSLATGAVVGMGLALSRLAVQGFKAVVAEGQAFTKTMSGVAALTGATGKEFSALEDTAKTLGKTTAFSAVEAGEGMSFLAQAGFETNEIIQTLPGTLNLAAAANVGLGKAADIVSNVLTGFGATAESTGKFVDVLTNTFTTSNTNLLQLGQAMKNVAPVAAALGISVEETATALAKMADAGIQGGAAGTQLKNALLNLTAPTAQQAALMEKLGIEIFDAAGNMLTLPQIVGNVNQGLQGLSQAQTVAAVKTLAGKRAIAGFQVLLNQGQPALEEYATSLEKTGTASDIAATQLDNLAGDVTLLQSAISGLEITAFEALEEGLRSSTQALTLLVTEFDTAVLGVNKANEQYLVATSALSTLAGGTGEAVTATQLLTSAWRESQAHIGKVIELNLEGVVAVGKLVVGEEELAKAFTEAGKATFIANKKAEASLRQVAQSAAMASGKVKELTTAETRLLIPAKLLIQAERQVNEALRLTAQEAAPVVSVYDSLTLSAKQLAEAQQEVASASQAAALASAFAQDIPEQAALNVITPEQRTAQAAALFEAGQVDIDTGGIVSSVSSAISDAFSQIKSAVSQVSGLTFNEILPPGETFRVDEWARRMQAVVNDGSNQFAQQAVTAFAGERFIGPLAEAVASGDPQAISDAAAEIINGPDLFELFDIEGAATQAEELIAQQNLGQRVNDAIAAVVAERQGLTGTGVGGETILNAIGLGEGADVTAPITDTITGLNIPGVISEALVSDQGEMAENPLLSLLGLGEDGELTTAITNFTGTVLPTISEALLLVQETFLTWGEAALLQLNLVTVATNTESQALLLIANSTLPTLKTQTVSTTTIMIQQFTKFQETLKETRKAIKELPDPLKKVAAIALEIAKNFERAAKAARAIGAAVGVGFDGGTGFNQGVGFSHGAGFKNVPGFQGGLGLGATVPGSGSGDIVPVLLEPREEILVAPKSSSINEIIANRLMQRQQAVLPPSITSVIQASPTSGTQPAIVTIPITINNQNDFEVTRNQLSILLPDLLGGQS